MIPALPILYREIAPSPALAQTIECGWTLEVRGDTTYRVVPDGCLDLLLRWQDSRIASVHVVGPMTRPQQVPLLAGQFVSGIRFQPGRFRAALDVPIPDLMDREAPLTRFSTPPARALEEIFRAGGRGSALTVFDNCLVGLESLLTETAATTPVDSALATMRAFLSERQFRRVCVRETGLSPKSLERILRFRKVWTSLHDSPHTVGPMSDLAHAFGYSDQAHLIREFREFSGETPGSCLRSLRR